MIGQTEVISGGNQTPVCPLHLALIIQQKRLAVTLTKKALALAMV